MLNHICFRLHFLPSLDPQKDLSKSIVMEEIDSSNGVMFIFYDPDTGMVYLAGKVGVSHIYQPPPAFYSKGLSTFNWRGP